MKLKHYRISSKSAWGYNLVTDTILIENEKVIAKLSDYSTLTWDFRNAEINYILDDVNQLVRCDSKKPYACVQFETDGSCADQR